MQNELTQATFVTFQRLLNFERQAEFARAALNRALGQSNKKPDIMYIGVLRPSQKDVVQALEKQVYDDWDSSAQAPAKRRPRSAAEQPSLSMLCWVNGVPKIPETLLNKFPLGSSHRHEIEELQKKLEKMWPAPQQQQGPQGGQDRARGVERTSINPDLTGVVLLDLDREVDLPQVSVCGFDVERPGV